MRFHTTGRLSPRQYPPAGVRPAEPHGELNNLEESDPMRDQPAPDQILDAISVFLRNDVMPTAESHLALEKLRVDQPNYSGCRAAVDRPADIEDN
jgi:hypothetical protein